MPRNPDSPDLKLLKNDKAHAHLHKNHESIKPSEKNINIPNHLSPRGKEIFYNMVLIIEEMYPCTESDARALTLYTENQEQLEYLENYLRLKGLSYESEVIKKDGTVIVTRKQRPEVAIHKECKNFALKILAEFGLTPASRNKIKIPKKPNSKVENPFAKLG